MARTAALLLQLSCVIAAAPPSFRWGDPFAVPVTRTAALLVQLSCVVAAAPPSYRWGETFAAQLHSYNDLRSWIPALSKLPPGAPRYLKIDPQYLPAPLCAAQSRATPADPRGCFVLNHDTVGPGARPTMNTSGDLLSWLQLPAASFLMADPLSLIHI